MRAPTSRGFGTRLLEQTVRSEGGSARMSVGTNGVFWEIALPLPSQPASAGAAPGKVQAPPASQSRKPLGKLAGKRFLVVEDDPLVAIDVAAGLEEAGAEVVASTGSAQEALNILNAILNKPFSQHQLIEAAARLFEQRDGVVQLRS